MKLKHSSLLDDEFKVDNDSENCGTPTVNVFVSSAVVANALLPEFLFGAQVGVEEELDGQLQTALGHGLV